MTERDVMEIGRHMILTAMKLALPPLLAGLVMGITVSIFQTVTQIQEFTLTFVPKLLAVIITLAVSGPWMMATMVDFIRQVYGHMPPVIR